MCDGRQWGVSTLQYMSYHTHIDILILEWVDVSCQLCIKQFKIQLTKDCKTEIDVLYQCLLACYEIAHNSTRSHQLTP